MNRSRFRGVTGAFYVVECAMKLTYRQKRLNVPVASISKLNRKNGSNSRMQNF